MSWDSEKSKRTSVGSEWLSEGLAIGLYSLSRSLTSLYSASSAVTTPIQRIRYKTLFKQLQYFIYTYPGQPTLMHNQDYSQMSKFLENTHRS